MLTTYGPTVLMALVLVTIVVGLAIAFSIATSTPDRLGGGSSPPPSDAGISSHRKPSIERSEKNSTVLLTLQANPDRPLVWSEEPVSGSTRLVKLTVVYERLPDDLALAILKSDDFALKPEPPQDRIDSVDDPYWIAKINEKRKNL